MAARDVYCSILAARRMERRVAVVQGRFAVVVNGAGFDTVCSDDVINADSVGYRLMMLWLL